MALPEYLVQNPILLLIGDVLLCTK